MNQRDSLNDIERSAYRATFEDGIYEISFGMLALILAWIPVLESIGISRAIGYILLIIPVAVPWIGKRLVTAPRLGSVEFGPQRRTRRRIRLMVLAAVVIFILPVVILMLARGSYGGTTWQILTLIIAPLIAVAIYAMDYPRMFIYAAMLLFAVAESEFLLDMVGSPFNTLLSFGLIGAALLLFGLALLARFVRRYPRPTAGADHVR